MQRFFTAGAGAIAVGMLLMFAAPSQGIQKATVRKSPPPDYFPLRWKYWWKYKTTTADGKSGGFTIKDIHDEKRAATENLIWHQVETDSGANMQIQDWYTKQDGFVLNHHQKYLPSGMEVDFEPVKQVLKNPLFKGDSWQWAGKGMAGVDITETHTVSGPELITVPAGKFKAMKVVTEVVQGGSPVTKTYWYGPNVGLVKSTTVSGPVKSTAELVQYQFPKLKPGEYEAELSKGATQ